MDMMTGAKPVVVSIPTPSGFHCKHVLQLAPFGKHSVVEKYSVNPPNVYGFGHQAYYEHVLDCLNYGHQKLVDGLKCRRSVELICATYESIETKKEVQLRVTPESGKLGMGND